MYMNSIQIRCPECHGELFSFEGHLVACENSHQFLAEGRIFDLLPITLNASVVADGAYHDSVKEEWVELNQVNTYRNRYYHRSIFKYIGALATKTPPSILELGGGNGFDLECFLEEGIPFGTYCFSEVSLPLVRYVAEKAPDHSDIYYLTADAGRLPFEDDQFDVIFVIAALHHLPNTDDGIAEIFRVLKPGGTFICGIEPNRKLSQFTKFAVHLLRPLMGTKSHSPADEEAEGFSLDDFEAFSKKASAPIIKIEPVWFFAGFLHYGLELIFRIFRLKKRIVVPGLVESLIIRIDLVLAKIGWIKKYFWHYSVYYMKN